MKSQQMNQIVELTLDQCEAVSGGSWGSIIDNTVASMGGVIGQMTALTQIAAEIYTWVRLPTTTNDMVVNAVAELSTRPDFSLLVWIYGVYSSARAS